MRATTFGGLISLAAVAAAQETTQAPSDFPTSIDPAVLSSVASELGPQLSSINAYITPFTAIPTSILGSLATSVPSELQQCSQYAENIISDGLSPTAVSPEESSSAFSCLGHILCYLQTQSASAQGGSVPSTCSAEGAQNTGAMSSGAMSTGAASTSSSSGSGSGNSNSNSNSNSGGSDSSSSSTSSSQAFAAATAVPAAAVAAGMVLVGML